MARKYLRLKQLTIILISTVCLGIIFLLRTTSKIPPLPRDNREIILRQVNDLINSGHGIAFEGQACRVPTLDTNTSEILKLLKESPKVVCDSALDWVEIKGSTAKISDWARKKYGDIECSFTEIIRETDYKQYQGMTTTTHTEFNLETSDIVNVHCSTRQGMTWQKVLIGIRSDQDIFDRTGWSKTPKDSLGLNVLMFGFDSLSHNMWKRKLPKTYNYATKDLKGIALNGYNIVGDGTPQALIPILTGRTELELPDTRKRMGAKAQYVNVYPFIWNDFRTNGYATAWSEDLIHVGTFTYRLKGFNEQPVDHYMRTFYVEADPHFLREKEYCYGGVTRFQIMLNFIVDMYRVYHDRPKFVFTFHSEYSHENNDWVSNADEATFKFIQDFSNKGYLNNTLLILMSDHGSRFSTLRNTQQGKQEERLPGFMFVFPSWFEKKYPEAYANFLNNSNRLTTPFDIHETLKNVLHFEGAGMGNLQDRGISLFKEIPLSRTCRDAGIEPHWCTCLDWQSLPVTEPIVLKAVNYFLDFINSYTSTYRNLCAKLKLGSILWSAKLLPNEALLRFKKNADYDGFVGDMSAFTAVSVETYQVKVSLEPGNMLYEASIVYYTRRKKFSVAEKDISRINRYKHMTHCIENADILHHLRKYCNCL